MFFRARFSSEPHSVSLEDMSPKSETPHKAACGDCGFVLCSVPGCNVRNLQSRRSRCGILQVNSEVFPHVLGKLAVVFPSKLIDKVTDVFG
jgi:hypothetical protein